MLVCGGRDFVDADLLRTTLDALHAEHRFQVLIEGAARGADTLAGDWADSRGIERLTFVAEWERLGRSAGPIRNERMLKEGRPDLVVAFPGGRGTAHMTRVARTAGVRVLEIPPPR